MGKAFISSFGLVKFGKRPEGVVDLMAQASQACLENAGLKGSERRVDEVVVANMASGEFEGVSGVANALVSELSLEPAYALKVENVSGSGGSALMYAFRMVSSGWAERVLVVGGEKMSTLQTPYVSKVVASLCHPLERELGVTLPSYAGLLAKMYLSKANAPRESLAHIAVKNHYNGSLNPYAHLQNEITIEQALSSPMVADPLRLYDFCPISDGAAAVLVTSQDYAQSLSAKPVEVISSEGATDTHAVGERLERLSLNSVRESSSRALKKAVMRPRELQLIEVHDMATVLEAVELEEIGVFPRFSGWRSAMDGATKLTGEIPVNTSGGLKAKGHPIGASGVAQAAEVYMQLTGKAGPRQVRAENALTVSMGGFGNNSVSTVYKVM
ncbi:MAG: thiolase family protein [Thermoprotei archaeon]